ncbi:MAG TPA: septal ring lytic transglycosylase RlpA family protein [Noviherbaspirillum sp.]
MKWQAKERIVVTAMVLGLAACSSVPLPPDGSAPIQSASSTRSDVPALPAAGSGRGGYYMDDGPGDAPPEGLLQTPDAEPRIEPYAKRGNKPYVVFGKTYTPITDDTPYKERGRGSWYGKKFHGQKTSSGELYDMYKMTAAHPTLPIPSYVRVTNVENGRQVIVRVNDRGPFLAGRIIDLSYTAALKLGYLNKGHAMLEVERLLPDDIRRINAQKDAQPVPLTEASAETSTVAIAADEMPARIELAALPAMASAEGNRPQATTAAGSGTMAAPVAVQATSSAPQSGLAPGIYLQFGAFGQAANAQAARTRLMQAGAQLQPVAVIEQDGLFRVYSGPYGSRAQAESAARALEQGGTQMPLIVQR